MNKADRRRLSKKEMRKITREQEALKKRAADRFWGAVLLVIGTFLMVVVEVNLSEPTPITILIFFLTSAVVCIGFGIQKLGIIGGVKKIFYFFIRKQRTEIETSEKKEATRKKVENDDDWSEF